MKDAVAFAYDGSMHHGVRKKHEVFLGDVNPLHMSDDKEGADNNVSRKTDTEKMTKGGDEHSAMDVQPAFWIDAPTKIN